MLNEYSSTANANNGKKPPTILCVDDEQQVLSSLKRFFRRAHYDVLIANGGEEALQVLEDQNVDLVISDMRMPGMTGAELLAHSAEKWPDTIRILLTGYADIESSIAAINEGRIYRYLSKPWDEKELIETVQQAVEYKDLKDEKQRLEKLTQEQNEKLKALNGSLEDKVKLRTHELQKAATMLRKSLEQLKNTYKESIEVFSGLIDTRKNISAVNKREIADMSVEIARSMKMDDSETDDMYMAALLCHIGKMALTDEILNKSYNDLNKYEKESYHQYPQIGQTILMAIPRLSNVGNIICYHKEHYDGSGFPCGLKSDDIPMPSKILALASDYYAMQSGEIAGSISSSLEAYNYIIHNQGIRYDEAVVEHFKNIYSDKHGNAKLVGELGVNIAELREGMILERNVTFRNGMLLLRKGQELNKGTIVKIDCIQNEIDDKTIYIDPLSIK